MHRKGMRRVNDAYDGKRIHGKVMHRKGMRRVDDAYGGKMMHEMSPLIHGLDPQTGIRRVHAEGRTHAICNARTTTCVQIVDKQVMTCDSKGVICHLSHKTGTMIAKKIAQSREDNNDPHENNPQHRQLIHAMWVMLCESRMTKIVKRNYWFSDIIFEPWALTDGSRMLEHVTQSSFADESFIIDAWVIFLKQRISNTIFFDDIDA